MYKDTKKPKSNYDRQCFKTLTHIKQMSKQHKMAAMSATDLTLRKYRGGGVATKLLLVYIHPFPLQLL